MGELERKKLKICGEGISLGNPTEQRNDSLRRKKKRKIIKQLKFIAIPPKESGSHY